MKNASKARPVGRPSKPAHEKYRNVTPISYALNKAQKAYVRANGGSAFIRCLVDSAMNGGAYHAEK